VEVGDALVCDTRKQVDRYIEFYNGDQEEAVRAINREEGDPTACGVVSAAFVRGLTSEPPAMGTWLSRSSKFSLWASIVWADFVRSVRL
jgi:hypothetical protein